LRYNLSSQKDPFVFASLKQRTDDDQIVIDPEEFRLSDLKTLLEFGIYREEDKSQADYDDLFRRLGTQLTGYARRWRNKLVETNIRSQSTLFKQTTGDYTFEDFVLAGYARVVLLDSPFTEVTAESISRRYDAGKPYSLDDDLRPLLEAELSTDGFNAVTAFMNDAEQYEAMIGALFGATANTLDVAAVRRRLQHGSPYDVLSGLGRTQITNVSSRVRFDTDNKLRDIANRAYDLQRALEDAEDEYRPEIVDVFETELSGLDLSEVAETVSTLRTYDSADPEMLESLSKFVSLSQSAVNDAVSAAEFAASSRSGTREAQLQSALVSLTLAGTSVYQRYDDITIVGGGTTSSFAERFLSVGEHYVE
jgi:hypothetical protein